MSKISAPSIFWFGNTLLTIFVLSYRSRSRSVGQILETNFDDPEPAMMPASGVSRMNNGHSRSMEGPQLAKLSLTPQLLETGL